MLVVTPDRIFQFLYDQASKIAQSKYGWLALGALMIIISFPPLIGHTTSSMLCGFAYGMKGFAIAAPATVLGSALVFVILRSLFGRRLRRWTEKNSKWQALEEVVESKGLGLIVLIRISPFPPWVYSNTLFAVRLSHRIAPFNPITQHLLQSISSVRLWQFVFATLFTLPKVCLHVFIGASRFLFFHGNTYSHFDS